MKYIAKVITTTGEELFYKAFDGPVPLVNRRRAIRQMKQVIKEVHTQTAPFDQIMRELGMEQVYQEVKTLVLNQLSFTVFMDVPGAIVEGLQGILPIESTTMDEKYLDAYRAGEYGLYLRMGWNTAGEPAEIFSEYYNAYCQVLRDNQSEALSFKHLLYK